MHMYACVCGGGREGVYGLHIHVYIVSCIILEVSLLLYVHVCVQIWVCANSISLQFVQYTITGIPQLGSNDDTAQCKGFLL